MNKDVAEDKLRIDHTPTPWINQGISVGADEIGTAFIIAANVDGLVAAALPWPTELDSGDFRRVEANAAFIVKAVNCHDDLIGTLEALLEDHVSLIASGGDWFAESDRGVMAAREALARAK